MKDSQSHRCGEASAGAEVFAGQDAEPTAALRLDTSGAVPCPAPDQRPNESAGCWFWSDLSPFAQGYVEALFASFERWPSTTFGDAKYPALPNANGKGVTLGLGFSDLAPETLAAILKDCEALAARVAGDRWRATGKLLWEHRQSGGNPDFPPLTPYLDDTGRVRLREAGQ